ncbi:carboxypeptidase S [Cristinia sonorae]|uniref:Carboxypeptidase S n=1 Tax=Cristinia sonorae TaxID=1940300 RepID=A0A8K0UTT9_9AGAR|nr:carboxypeptidase S [Cristinia sonorae]
MGKANDVLDAGISPRRNQHRRHIWRVTVLVICAAVNIYCYRHFVRQGVPQDLIAAVCPQAAPITPTTNAAVYKDLERQYATQQFKLKAYESLGGAVRIPTEAYDDLKPPGEDPRWDIFAKFHQYLEARFPLVHTTLRKTTVNKYALVFHWQGSDSSLKPVLLTAHQDVVPVEPLTLDQWIEPPYSGLYDGKWIWGRGSCDDKPGLIGSLTAVESLIAKGFKPKRTVVLAYGIDEERGGIEGGPAIRDHLIKTYGTYGFSILVDEGGDLEVRDNIAIASPAVAEKGHFDLRLAVSTIGGHSSVPPAHTSIGILAGLIVQLEDNPHEPHVFRNDTYYTNLQCQAAYDPDLDEDLRSSIQRSLTNDRALRSLEAQLFKTDRRLKAIGSTTQAADLINGGVKVNALPEEATAVVNHRIAGWSSVAALKARIVEILQPAIRKYNLSVNAFGEQIDDPEKTAFAGHLTLSDAFGTALEPAPITSTSSNPAYQFLSGTIIAVQKTSAKGRSSNAPVVVAPGILIGNTDTRYYWNVTRNIFRYGHVDRYARYNGAHTINEALEAEAFIELIRFFTTFILNADESKLLK